MISNKVIEKEVIRAGVETTKQNRVDIKWCLVIAG